MCTSFTRSHLIDLRDLNHGLGCSPLGDQVYPGHPFPDFYDVEAFGVGQRIEGFPLLNPRSVALPLQQSPSRLDYGQLWQEPAIFRLDWLFTPIPKLEEHVHVEPLQASTKFYLRFALLRNRSPDFESYPSDCAHFHRPAPHFLRASCFRFGYLSYPRHSNKLPGTFFKTHGRTPKGPALP